MHSSSKVTDDFDLIWHYCKYKITILVGSHQGAAEQSAAEPLLHPSQVGSTGGHAGNVPRQLGGSNTINTT